MEANHKREGVRLTSQRGADAVVQIEVRSRATRELVDITGQVRGAVRESGISDGVCMLFVPHTTAGLTLKKVWSQLRRFRPLILAGILSRQ